MPVRSKHIKYPFRADFNGGIVFNADGFHFADVRGWGALQHEFKTQEEAAKAQDEHLQYMVDALNEKWAREHRCKMVWRAGVLRPPGQVAIQDGARCTLPMHDSTTPHNYDPKKHDQLYNDLINSIAERNRKDREDV